MSYLRNSISVSSGIRIATWHTTFGCLWMQVANKQANSPPKALQSDGINNNDKKEENTEKVRRTKCKGCSLIRMRFHQIWDYFSAMNSSSFDHCILFGRVLISPLMWWQHRSGFLATNERRADDCYLLPPSLKENCYSDALLLFLPTHFQPGLSDNQTLVIPISLQIQLEKKIKAKQNK